jgi:Tfp pilus assembly protein PilE
MKHHSQGSTFLELLIILVIVGVLVQQAVPHYGVFIEQARARERLAILLSLQTQIEACYTERRDYDVCATLLEAPSPHVLETEATAFTYRLLLRPAERRQHAPCDAYETNEQHDLNTVCS